MSNVIIPTIGRKLWLWRNGTERTAYEQSKAQGIDHPLDQPLDASICYTHNNNLINVTAADRYGVLTAYTQVALIQDGEPWTEATGKHCSWMPYQQGQAKAQAERVTPAMVEER